MRIAEVISNLVSGGAERFVVDLCNEFVELGHEVLLIVFFPVDNNELFFYLPQLDSRVKVVSMNKQLGADFTLPFRLRKAIRDYKPDIVHTHLVGITYSAFSAVFHGPEKYVHTIHNDAQKEAMGGIESFIRKFLFKGQYSHPVTISKESLQSFRDYYHRDADMIVNGRNMPGKIEFDLSIKDEVESFKNSQSTRIITNIARWADEKRQDLIAHVCKRLELEGYDFAMLFIGATIDKNVLKRVQALSCKSVHILGERDQTLQYLSLSDGFCLFSSYEGMPISLIEALGCGAVPICTPVGGIVNTVHDGINGFLSNDISEDECYMALKRFLDSDSKTLHCMSESAKKSFRSYGIEECALRYIELFKRQLN